MFSTARAYGLHVKIIKHLRREISLLHDSAALAELVIALRRLKPQIVHTHSSKAGILGRLAAKLAGVPIVVHTIHGLPFFPYQSTVKNRAYILAEQMAGRWTDKLLAVAEDMVRQGREVNLAPAEKFLIVPSPLEAEMFYRNEKQGEKVREYLDIPPGAFVVGMVARLAPLKGHEYLLEALEDLMPRHEELFCLLVGDGELRSEIEKRLSRSGLANRLCLTGLVQPRKIPELLWAMDMLVHTSLHEGLPRAVVQGLLAGLPVAAFDLDGAREVIEPGRTGYLIEPKSVQGLTEAIEAIVSGSGSVKPPSPQQIEQLAERFSWRVIVSKLEELYKEMLSQHREGVDV